MSADPYEENHRKRRRNRMRVSCLNCYASKRKCDRKRPCSRCTKHGLTGLCVYELDDPEARDPSLDETTHLRNRIAELESVIRELNNRPHPRWFTASGTEHLPELVAARRSSTTSTTTDISNFTADTSTASMNSNPTPRKASLRARTLNSSFKSQEGRVSGNAKIGTKRKYQEDDSTKIRDTSSYSVGASFTSKSRKGLRGNAGRKGHHSDASYLTDDDDDDYIDDEDYEEDEPRSCFRNTNRRPRVPAGFGLVQRTEKTAYTFPNRHKSSRNVSHNNNPTGCITIVSSDPASQSTSVLGTCPKTESNAPGDPPSSPTGKREDNRAAADQPKINHSNCQSTLGLIFDGNDSYSNTQPQAEDYQNDESETRRYSLRQNVVWSDREDDDCMILDSAPVTGNLNKRTVKLTLKVKEPEKSCRILALDKNKKSTYDDDPSALDEEICSSLGSTAVLCSHLTRASDRSSLASFIKALGDTRDVLKLAHGISNEVDTSTKIECELFRRIIGLDDYLSSIGNVHQTRADEHTLPGVIIPNAVHANDEDSSFHVPGVLPGGDAQIHVEAQEESPLPAATSIKSAPLPYSAPVKKGSKKKKSCTKPTAPVPIVSAAPLSPAPTPASILARSALQQHAAKTHETTELPSTVTLASILASTRGTDPPPSLQQLTTPPRLNSTPGPTLLPTPTFSPSSPFIRSVNAAIRRPDADFLPFYSNHFNIGENDTDHSRTLLMGSFMHRGQGLALTGQKQQDLPRCSTENDVSISLDAFNFGPLLNLDPAKITEVKNSSSTVVIPVVPNIKETDGNMVVGVDEEIELDVDAEGEPAPESGYEYGYFDDGYRYECVWVSDT